MITMKIEIADVKPGQAGNEFGAGVRVESKLPPGSHLISDAEGATWTGLCIAINDYMRARGCPEFDCLRAKR